MMRAVLLAACLVGFALPAQAQVQARQQAQVLRQQLEQWANDCAGGEGEVALSACTAIIRSDNATSGVRAFSYRQRGLIHYDQGEEARALEDFSSAIQHNPHFVEAYISRAALYEARGDYDLGAADYDEVLRIMPTFGPAYNARCWLKTLSGRDLADARADCDRAIELRAGAPAYETRGLLNLKDGRFEAALADYGVAVETGRTAHALYGRGLAALRLGRTEAGQADIAAATAADPTLPQTFQRYGAAP